MKNINTTTIIAAISTLAIGLLLGWLIFGQSAQDENREHEHGAVTGAEQTWTCSMHPQIRRNEAGDCPICGMDLIPLEESEDGIDPKAVSMSATAMQLAQVQTAKVGYGEPAKAIRLNGKVQVDERRAVTQSSHLPGRIEELYIDFTGDFVKQGQLIANVYSPELVTAQEELLEAEKIKASQPELFRAAQEKLKNWKLSDAQIQEILASKAVIEKFPILSNVSGYVLKKMVDAGDYVKQGQSIYKIADLSKVWILFDVYESDISWVNQGMPVSYSVQSIPGETYEAKISYIDPIINPKTRVAKARIEVSNPNLALKPEMFVSGQVSSELNGKDTLLTVPKSAVMWTGKRSVVYVMQKSSKGVGFMMREVTLGPELGDAYVIESGLQDGEEIAVYGTFSIDAAAQLAGKPSMMNRQDADAERASEDSSNKYVNLTSEKHSVSDAAKAAIQPLFNSYFKMKQALADDDFSKASEAGKAMGNELNKLDKTAFKEEAKELLTQQIEALQNNLQYTDQLKDIDTLRASFIGISNAIIAMAESFDPFPETVYVQHCPMADSDNGADWLSLEKEILNPYFGASMLACGETTKTIE